MQKIPGSLAYIDIMTLLVEDMIAQMTSFLIREHFYYTYIFVDNKSDLTFIYYTKMTDVAEVLEAK